MTDIINDYILALLEGNKIKADEILSEYSDNKLIIEEIITKSLEEIGNMWENRDAALAQVYISGIICEELINKYMLELKTKAIQNNLNIAIVTFEDYHALGKRIVLSFLKSAGFVVKDYGIGKTVDEVYGLSIKDNIDILLISTLMLPSALKANLLIRKLKDKKKNIRIIVGGAPFRIDKTLWKDVEADAVGISASHAVELVRKMVRE